MTPEEKALAEQARALVTELDTHKDELKHLKSVRERVDAVASKLDLQVADMRKLSDRVEANLAANERIARIIRNRQDGMYVTGLEDQTFNTAKAIYGLAVAAKANALPTRKLFETLGASQEFEVLKQVEKKHGHQWLESAKAQNVTDDELGGAFVPSQVLADQLIVPTYRESVLIGLENGQTRVTVLDNITSTGQIDIPSFVGGAAAGWLGEQQVGAATQVKTAMKSMRPRKAGCWLALTEDLIRGAAYGFSQLLEQDLRHALADLLDQTIMYGTGTEHEPRGIVKTDGVRIFKASNGKDYANVAAANADTADWQGGELEFRKQMMMQLVLKRNKVKTTAASWITSPDFVTRMKARQLAQYTGQTEEKAFLLGAPFLSDAQLKAIIGDFGETPFVPYTNKPGASIQGATTSTTLKFSDVLYGNLQQVLLAMWGGIQIVTDDGKGLGFPSEVTLVRARIRADVTVRRPDEMILCPDAQAID